MASYRVVITPFIAGSGAHESHHPRHSMMSPFFFTWLIIVTAHSPGRLLAAQQASLSSGCKQLGESHFCVWGTATSKLRPPDKLLTSIEMTNQLRVLFVHRRVQYLPSKNSQQQILDEIYWPIWRKLFFQEKLRRNLYVTKLHQVRMMMFLLHVHLQKNINDESLFRKWISYPKFNMSINLHDLSVKIERWKNSEKPTTNQKRTRLQDSKEPLRKKISE